MKIGNGELVELREDAELQDAVEDAKDCHIVITNPPFTNRVKMGEKFKDHLKKKLRSQVDGLERMLTDNDEGLKNIVNKNALRPLFVGIAEKCANEENGIFTMIAPTIAMSGPSGINERIELAKRFHVHTILTVHCPGDVNMSQDVGINESILLLQRNCSNVSKPTRFINLDKFPSKAYTVEDFHKFLDEMEGQAGRMRCEWGEVSYWPRERMERGDWTPAIWRSPELAEAAAQFAECQELKTLAELGFEPQATGQVIRGNFEQSESFHPGAFPIIKSKSEDGQTTIQSQPDEYWIHKKRDSNETSKMLKKASHLLLSQGQGNESARLIAIAADEKYVGNGWIPVTGLTAEQAKALAVFLNSTAGRLQLLRNMAQNLTFPLYQPIGLANIRVPDVLGDGEICRALLECWEDTKHIKVPQYRDGDDWDRKHSPRNPQEKPKDWLTGQAAAAFAESKVGEGNSTAMESGKLGSSNLLVSDGGQDSEKLRSNVRLAGCLNPRPLWDACVARVFAEKGKAGRGLSAEARSLFKLRRLNALRKLLHREPHIRGKSCHQYQ